jgi:Fe2+ transport system protein FeoA
MNLDELTGTQQGTVRAVHGEGPFRRRLLELGLVPGTPVDRVGAAPLGDPVRYRVRGAIVTLRHADAAKVELA